MRSPGSVGGRVVCGILTAALWTTAAGAAPLLLDHFNDGKTENALGGATGAWYDPEDPSIFCRVDYVEEGRFGLAGKSMRLDYNIQSQREHVHVPTNVSVPFPAGARNEAFLGYYSVFPPQDLRQYGYLMLWARGDPVAGYTRSFKIEIKDGGPGPFKGYKVTGLTDQWKRFVIPLREFLDINKWSEIKEFVIVLSADAVSRKFGTLYLDDIYFAETPDQNISMPEGVHSAERARRAVTVDGHLKDWPRGGWNDISPDWHVESGGRSGLADASARWAARWDDQWLYLAVALKDNERVNDQTGDGLWRGDCVEVYLAPGGRELTWGDPGAFQLGFSPTSQTGEPARWAWFQNRAPTDEEARVAWNDKRTVMEAAIAWTFLNIEPVAGREMGFSVSFHDRDVNDKTPQCKLTWSLHNINPKRVRLGKVVLQ